MIKEDKFLEYQQIYTNYYGTSKTEIDRIFALNKIPTLDIDIKGVINLSKISKFTKINPIFIMPPSIEDLKKRLLGRGSETEETIKIRMNRAEEEIQLAKTSGVIPADNFVVNENS